MAENFVPIPIGTFVNDTSAVQNYNANLAAIQAAFADVLSRSGVSPNQMGSTLDMNSFPIINLPPPGSPSSPARLEDITSSDPFAISISMTGDVTAPASSGVLNTTISAAAQTRMRMGQLSVTDFAGVDPTGVNDSTTGFQNAIDAALTNSGTQTTLYVPPGQYQIQSTLTLGNGNSTTASTQSGIRIVGLVNPIVDTLGFSTGAGAEPTIRLFRKSGNAGDALMSVLGPLQGIEISNLCFDGNSICAGLDLISVQYSVFKNLYFRNCTVTGLNCNTVNSGTGTGFANADTLHNVFENLYFDIPDINDATGMNLSGNASGTADTAYCNFTNLTFVYPNTNTANTLLALYLGSCDSNMFNNVHVTNGSTACNCITFDYTVVSGGLFPNTNYFWGLDASGSSAPPTRFTNIGSPGGSAVPNFIFANNTNGQADGNYSYIKNLQYLSNTNIGFSNSGLTLNSPVTNTTNYAVKANDYWIIQNGSGTTELTLPTPSGCPGRILNVKTIANEAVASASNNVVALTGGSPTSTMISNTAGNWCVLACDGTNWNIMMSGP